MKKFLHSVLKSKVSKEIRCLLNIRPDFYTYVDKNRISASDLFVWINNENIRTLYVSDNPIKKYADEKSFINLIFFNNNGKFICKKEYKIENEVFSVKIEEIDDQLVGVGTFYAFITSEMVGSDDSLSIINRTYVGYAVDNQNYSFIHGNLVAGHVNINDININIENIEQAIVGIRKKTRYKIQKRFEENRIYELIWVNPLSRCLLIKIFNKRILMPPRAVHILRISHPKTQIIEYYSDSPITRPLVLSYAGKFLDAQHG